jgi:hypothetical protein
MRWIEFYLRSSDRYCHNHRSQLNRRLKKQVFQYAEKTCFSF